MPDESNTAVLEAPAETESVETEPGALAPVESKTTDTPGVPEKYDLKLDGEYEAITDKGAFLEETGRIARELGLKQEQAQKLAQHRADTLGGYIKSVKSAQDARVKEWRASLEGDKDFGGDKWDETKGKLGAFVKQHGDQELIDALAKTGYSDWPPLVRFVQKAVSERDALKARLDKITREHNFVPSNQPVVETKPKTDADVFGVSEIKKQALSGAAATT